jgi:PAS domain S-box-containing protein
MEPSRSSGSSGNSPTPVNEVLASGGNSLGRFTASLWQKALWFSVAYFLCAEASNYLSPHNIPFRVFWLPAGLYAAVLLLNETRAWPWLVLAAMPANFAFDLLQGTPLTVIFSFFGANTVQAVTGAWLMRRFVSEKPNLRTEKEFYGIIILLGLGSSMLGASISATTLVTSSLSHSFGQSWLTWWLDSMSAIMVVTPLILAWFSSPDDYHQRFLNQRKKVLEAALLVVAALATCGYFLIFSNGIMSPNKSPVLIVLMWAGLRFGTRGATAIGLLVSLTFLFFTTQYFTGLTPDQISSGSYITPLQVAWVMSSMVGLFPAMVLRQRDDKMEELRVSEVKFRTLVENIPQRIFLKGRDLRYLSANDNYARDLGIRPSDISGKNDFDFYPRELAEKYRTDDKYILDTGKTEEFEEKYSQPGRALWVHTVKTPVHNIKGEITGVFGIFWDITEAKEAETLLRLSEEKYRKIFENVQDVFYQVDNRGTIVEISPSIERYTGQSREDLLGKAVTEFYCDPKDRDDFFKNLRDKGEVNDYELRLKTKTGRLVYASVNAHVLLDAEGKPAGTEGSLRDITERKRAAEQIQMLKVSIDQHFDSAFWMDTDNRFVFVNDTACRALGYTREELLGKPVSMVATNATPQTLEDVWKHLRETGFVSRESMHRRKNGSQFPVEIVATYVRFEGKEFNCGFARDITERKRIEQELERHRTHLEDLVTERTAELQLSRDKTEAAYQKLRELEKLRDDLVHMVVHDMRSPLTGLGMYLDLLSPEEVNAPDFQENLGLMRETSRTLSGMVTSLLDVSRMESGQMPLHCEVSDLGQLTSAALKQLSGLIQGRQISVRGSDSSVLAYCDPVLTQRIFENLVGNALKFTPEAGSVRIELAVEGSWGRFSITDTGPGIPVEYHKKVFEKFGQVEMRKDRKTPSSGLGLAFCKLAVEAQGGSIQLESEPGHGTTFHVRLPKHAPGTTPRNAT